MKNTTDNELKQAYQEWMDALDKMDDAVFMHDKDFRILRCNMAYKKYAGLPFKDIIGHLYFEIFPKSDAPLQSCMKTSKNSIVEGVQEEIKVEDKLFRSRAYTVTDSQGIYLYSLHTLEDITSDKMAKDKLKLFRTLIDNSSDAIEVLEPTTLRFLDVNETDCRLLGYTKEEMLSMSVFDIDTTFTPETAKDVEEAIKKEGQLHFETIHQRKDGSTFPVEVSVTRIEVDKPYILSIARDITQRKKNEESLRRSNRALKTLSECNLALVRAQGEDELLQEITRIIVENGQYSLAVVDYAQNDPKKSIQPVAWSGLEKREYWIEDLSWADTPDGQLPVSIAIRTGETQICRDITKECSLMRWREGALSHGYLSNISLPLLKNGSAFGALCIYSSLTQPFDEEEVKLLEELASYLSYGIVTIRTRITHEEQRVHLQESMEQFIQAIASTVESRDPYTAGHQQRVGDLATAIAQDMKLPPEQIQGVYFAAIIHDLGKIHVPAEILSKPGKLNDIEYKLIQMHPQSGYDILKDVKFPWPIAQIILQHHEKIDGSGYPQGLKGDEILLEAKIIAVADVVEAMSSHRPYRPALGIEVALDEIKRGRGTIYEPSVVDSCLKLFNDKKFKFSSRFG